jgi:hypothetical protein
MATMNDQLSMERTPAQPELVNAYDAKAGRPYDSCCGKTTAPSPAKLPGTPMPFANLRAGK